jgi:hypothetical protein
LNVIGKAAAVAELEEEVEVVLCFLEVDETDQVFVA